MLSEMEITENNVKSAFREKEKSTISKDKRKSAHRVRAQEGGTHGRARRRLLVLDFGTKSFDLYPLCHLHKDSDKRNASILPAAVY